MPRAPYDLDPALGKATLEMLALVIPYSENDIRYGMTLFFLAFALSDKLMSIVLPIFVLPLLGWLSGVKPHLNLLALVIPYSGNPKVRYYTVFILGRFYIKKKKLLPLFFADFKG